jgi:heme-degrading monooxygenase HmoA
MYARTVYAVGDPTKIEDSLEALRTEAPKLLADSPGFRSYGLFADRDLGKIAMASWWETEQDRANSDQHLAERRTGLLTPFADSIMVTNPEVAAFGQSPQLAEARAFQLGRFMIEPSRIDDLIALFKKVGLPRLEGLPNFCGAALFVDRARGAGAVGTLFTDRASLKASRPPQSAARRQAVQETGLQAVALEEFEVVLLENNPESTDTAG